MTTSLTSIAIDRTALVNILRGRRLRRTFSPDCPATPRQKSPTGLPTWTSREVDGRMDTAFSEFNSCLCGLHWNSRVSTLKREEEVGTTKSSERKLEIDIISWRRFPFAYPKSVETLEEEKFIGIVDRGTSLHAR